MQHRRRVIILAAALGQPLPHFPEPTHVFNAGLSSSGTEGSAGGGGSSLKVARERRACANVPTKWRAHVKAGRWAFRGDAMLAAAWVQGLQLGCVSWQVLLCRSSQLDWLPYLPAGTGT